MLYIYASTIGVIRKQHHFTRLTPIRRRLDAWPPPLPRAFPGRASSIARKIAPLPFQAGMHHDMRR